LLSVGVKSLGNQSRDLEIGCVGPGALQTPIASELAGIGPYMTVDELRNAAFAC